MWSCTGKKWQFVNVLSSTEVTKPGMHFTHFQYKCPHPAAPLGRQIIPAAPVSLSVSWISGLSGMLWCIGSLPLPNYLSFFLSLSSLLRSLSLLCLSVSFLSPPCLPLDPSFSIQPSLSLSLSLCDVSPPSLLLPLIESSPSESCNLSVHGVSAIQMSGSSRFWSLCFSNHFGLFLLASLFISITTLVPPSYWPSFNPVSHCLTLSTLTSWPLFLSHINLKSAFSSFQLLRFLSSVLLFPLLPAFTISISNFHFPLCMLTHLFLPWPCPLHLFAFLLFLLLSCVFRQSMSSWFPLVFQPLTSPSFFHLSLTFPF